MTKRKVTFNENIDVKKYKNEEPEDGQKIQGVNYAFKSKHSLDSDEEDNPEDIKEMGYNDIEGQEKETISEYDTIEITPFNMRDEMDEGKFDEHGNFIFNKKKMEIRDNWIDNINWVEIKKQNTNDVPLPKPEESDSDNEIIKTNSEINQIYSLILNLLMPGENVLKALRRLGNIKKQDPLADKFSSSASARLKFKKEQRKKAEIDQTEDLQPSDEPLQNDLLKLTGLADELLQNGIYDIYEHTYEKLTHLIKQQLPTNLEGKTSQAPVSGLEELQDREKPVDSNLDMFEGMD